MMNPVEPAIILDFIGHTDFAAAVRDSYHCPGAAKLAAVFNHYRRQNPEGLCLLDAGDVLVAAPIINLTDGTQVIEIVNLFGYDAMTLGNHEFDHGAEKMQRVLGHASFPLLCANIIERATGQLLPYVAPFVIVEKKGVKIGILGVTTEYTPFMVKEDAFAPFEVTSVIDACNRTIPEMKARGAEIVVVLGHLPGKIEADGTFAGEMAHVAEQVAGIDILFGGHNQGDIALVANGIICSKTGFSAQSIGHIRIAYDPGSGKIECLANEIIPVLHDRLGLAPEPLMAREVDRILAPYLPKLDEVVGTAEDDLIVSASAECSLGNFFTDCYREVCDAQIGLMNSTSCFGYMPKGPITAEMIMWVMCFDDHLYRGRMTGKQLRAMLERTYESRHMSLNGSLQLSGLRVVLDSSLADGKRIVSIVTVDGTPLQEEAEYCVATSAYIASGGNDYRDIIEQTTWERTDLMAHATLIDKMRERGTLNATIEGRIVDLSPAPLIR